MVKLAEHLEVHKPPWPGIMTWINSCSISMVSVAEIKKKFKDLRPSLAMMGHWRYLAEERRPLQSIEADSIVNALGKRQLLDCAHCGLIM
jgi:hypothetical protein